MTDRARAVVIGGGVTGCSVAYHLAKAGWSDVLLLDKGELTSGSTAHAAGLVTTFNPSPTMMRFRRYSIDLYRELGVFETVGSLRFASSPEQLKELERGVSRAHGIGLEAELVSAVEASALMPAASADSSSAPCGCPGTASWTHTARRTPWLRAPESSGPGSSRAYAQRASSSVRLARFEVLSPRAVISSVRWWSTPPGCGRRVWPRWPAPSCRRRRSIISIALRAVRDNELPADMPCFRDPDNLVYGKSEHGGMLFGGYEGNPRARWIDGVPWEHESRSLPPDHERFEPLMRGAIRRFPFLDGAEVVALVCHPDAMTPMPPLLGPLPGIRGFYVAAGLSLNGLEGRAASASRSPSG